MSEYHRFNFNKLNFAQNTITYEEALKDVASLELRKKLYLEIKEYQYLYSQLLLVDSGSIGYNIDI